jgi:hypothetical protein
MLKRLEFAGPTTQENESEWKYEFCRQMNEAPGRSAGEVARRVICEINTEIDRFSKMLNAEEISCKAFANAVSVLNVMHWKAAQVWNSRPESAAAGWRA